MHQSRPTRLRILWLVVACAAVAVGAVGILVPGLPTTPFLILGAFAAARSSPRLHAWLLGHRVFGRLIGDWQAHRAVSRRAKGTATATMAACAALLFVTAPALWLAAAATGLMALVGTWLWLRPEPQR